ncbi:MAG: CPBP family intramembrane metalloprotease [Methanosphaera sp.]|nr:CPBP family intramembrane metalloprotease [Methanosphaera sp.]
MTIPFVIATNGKLGSLFKKPKLSDLKLVILCVLGDLFILLLFAIIHVLINSVVPFNIINTTQSFGEYSSITLLTFIVSLFQIISEELFRVITFLIMLYLMYRFTNNRKTSIIVASIFSLALFGLMHANTYGNIIYCILIMGFGTFFTLYPYLKTKNVLLSILVHMIYNLLVLIVQTSV